MLLNSNAQVFSLDFLVSLAAVTLAVGLLIQSTELKTYNEKEELRWLELKRVAETAGNALVSSPKTICSVEDVRDNSELFKLVNCIDTSKAITNQTLGIPSNFGFSVEGLPSPIGDATPNNVDFYAVKRTVVWNHGALSKDKFERHSFDSGGEPIEVTITVWRKP